jgi:hypothetical protein
MLTPSGVLTVNDMYSYAKAELTAITNREQNKKTGFKIFDSITIP